MSEREGSRKRREAIRIFREGKMGEMNKHIGGEKQQLIPAKIPYASMEGLVRRNSSPENGGKGKFCNCSK